MLDYLYGKGFGSKVAWAKPFPYKYSNILKRSHSSYLSAYEDGTECSETSAYKIQTSGNYPEESIRHSEHGESLKSRMLKWRHFSSLARQIQLSDRSCSQYKRSAIIWDITQRIVAVPYIRFGATCRSHLQGSSYPIFLDWLNHKSLKSRNVHNTLCPGV